MLVEFWSSTRNCFFSYDRVSAGLPIIFFCSRTPLLIILSFFILQFINHLVNQLARHQFLKIACQLERKHIASAHSLLRVIESEVQSYLSAVNTRLVSNLCCYRLLRYPRFFCVYSCYVILSELFFILIAFIEILDFFVFISSVGSLQFINSSCIWGTWTRSNWWSWHFSPCSARSTMYSLK